MSDEHFTGSQFITALEATYAPIRRDGPLPRELSAETVDRAYRSMRPDFKPRKLLKALGSPVSIAMDARTSLRVLLDSAAAREGVKKKVPPLHEALYQTLRKEEPARAVYQLLIRPAEVSDSMGRVFLNPRAFATGLTCATEIIATPVERIVPGTPADVLAQFVLAYGLLQSEDASILVRSILQLGKGFADYFGVRQALRRAAEVDSSFESESFPVPDATLLSPLSMREALSTLESCMTTAAADLRHLAHRFEEGAFAKNEMTSVAGRLKEVQHAQQGIEKALIAAGWADALNSITDIKLAVGSFERQARDQSVALAVLDEAGTIKGRDRGHVDAIATIRAKVAALRVGLVTAPEVVGQLVDGAHGVSALLRLVREIDSLDDEDLEALRAAVTKELGPSVARAASRGGLVLTMTDTSPPETSSPTAPECPVVTSADIQPDVEAVGERRTTIDPERADSEPLVNVTVPNGVQEETEHEAPVVEVPGAVALTVEELPREEASTGEAQRSWTAPVLEPATTDVTWKLVAARRMGLMWHLTQAREAIGVQTPIAPAVAWLLMFSPYIRSSSAPPVAELGSCLEAISGSLSNLAARRDGVAVATQLMLAGALLRPSLLAAHSGAPSLLNQLTVGGQYFRELCGHLSKLGQRPQEVTPSLLKGVREVVAWERQRDALMTRCHEWLVREGQASIIYAPTTDVWREWLGPSSSLGSALGAAIGGRTTAGQIEDAIQEWSDIAAIEAKLAKTDRQLRKRLSELRPIEARAKSALIKRVGSAVELLKEWPRLTAAKPAGGDQALQRWGDELRKRVMPLLAPVRTELEDASGRLRPPALAAVRAVVDSSMDDVIRLFDPAVDDVVEIPELRAITSAELLGATELPLDSDWQPEGGYTPDVCRVLETLAQREQLALVDAYHARREARDHRGTEWVLALMDQRGVDVAAYRAERDMAVAAERAALKRAKASVSADVERAASYDLLSEQLHLDLTAKLSSVNPEKTLSFEPANRTLAEIRRLLNDRAQARVAIVKERLSEVRGASEADLTRVNRALDAGNFLAANEYIDLLNGGGELPEAVGETVFDAFFPTFVKGAAGPPLQVRELINAVRNQKPFGPVRMHGVRGPQAAQAADMLEVWFAAKGRMGDAERRTDQLRTLFEAFGFSNVRIKAIHGSLEDRRWRGDLNVAPIIDRNVCVLPQFGSTAKGNYRILCIWDRPSEDEILSLTSSDAHVPLFVMYFGLFSVDARRRLAALCRDRRRSLLLVDEGVVLFLAGVRGHRLPVLFNLTLPFTAADPYVTTAGLLPPEMFFGRAVEKESVFDPLGTNLIYGGRQLGKTALLRDVERTYHRPSEGVIVVWLDLRSEHIGLSRPIDDIWGVMGEALRRHVALSGNAGDSDALIASIQAWLSANTGRRIVFLLDEADVFLEVEGRNDFRHVHRLKNLMDATDKRFKVVFAGLHNVQRASRAVNTPLAHLGEPICIGPLLNDRGAREALALITTPLGALGYRFEPADLAMRILSHTNYYPSLIQIFCKHLLQYLAEPGASRFDSREAPPYTITERHLDAVQNEDLRTKILDKFRLTLDLDPRYRLIALSLAWANAVQPGLDIDRRGVDPGWVRTEAMNWWAKGFAEDTSLEGFKNILDEMIGLGILRRVGEARYALRSPNLGNLLGSSNEIGEHLLDAADREPPVPYEQGEFRRAHPERPYDRSPLTAQQEAEVLQSGGGVAVVCGTMLGGIGRVPEFLQILGPQVVIESQVGDASRFVRSLTDRLRRVQGPPRLIVVTSDCPWGARWIEQSIKVARQQAERKRPVRIIFVADSKAALAWVSDSDARRRLVEQGVLELSLRSWSDSAVRVWLEERELLMNDRERHALRDATGLWSQRLWQFGRKCQEQPDSWRSHINDLKEFHPMDPHRPDNLAIPVEVVKPLRCLAEIGDTLNVQQIAQLDATISLNEAERAVRWGELVGYVRIEAGDAARLDPFVAAQLASRR